MRTRMVPFQRHVQRLARIVRQAANDTGKRAELVVQGASGELDRQVLERMVPPFEHMLRNAVVHGIETPERRAALGKPDVGRISVSLTRDGAEVVVVVTDDGAGMNLKLIREKAVALGLTDRHSKLTDEEAMQLILEPGFSTAGRSRSRRAAASAWTWWRPRSRSSAAALFMEINAGEGHALHHPPAVHARDQPGADRARCRGGLRAAAADGRGRACACRATSWRATSARMRRCSNTAARNTASSSSDRSSASDRRALPETDVSMPVVLVRAGEHSTALVTDELVGSREIVVKSVGPQISGIRGISGATILGDGRIVIILDMGALVRSEWRARPTDTAVLETRDRRTFALVVDDSITVRRVTQRLLERNGMRVLTAKDGMDAVSLLQENLPDIILLDIEMPRMDGYEVAAHVRSDPRLKHIPIIMITSRVGEKHRARAIELGVDDYLGKPYQENQLLDAIEPLVNRRRAVAR